MSTSKLRNSKPGRRPATEARSSLVAAEARPARQVVGAVEARAARIHLLRHGDEPAPDEIEMERVAGLEHESAGAGLRPRLAKGGEVPRQSEVQLGAVVARHQLPAGGVPAPSDANGQLGSGASGGSGTTFTAEKLASRRSTRRRKSASCNSSSSASRGVTSTRRRCAARRAVRS